MQQLTERGITVIVNLAPILPFMNDDMENIQGLLSYCVKAGVYGILTDKMCPVLREGNRERFYQQLYKNFPDIYDRYEAVYADEKTLKTKIIPRLWRASVRPARRMESSMIRKNCFGSRGSIRIRRLEHSSVCLT